MKKKKLTCCSGCMYSQVRAHFSIVAMDSNGSPGSNVNAIRSPSVILDQIPIEVLSLIFSHLNDPFSIIRSCSRVNRKWNQCAKGTPLRLSLTLCNRFDRCLKIDSAWGHLVEKAVFLPEISPSDVVDLLNKCTRLKVLYLLHRDVDLSMVIITSSLTSLTISAQCNGLPQILSQQTQLQRIVLHSASDLSMLDHLPNPLRLRVVELPKYRGTVSTLSLSERNTKLPGVICFAIEPEQHIFLESASYEELHSALRSWTGADPSCALSLQELRISGKQVNVIDGVQLFDKIETLHITRSSVVDMTALAQCPHLRHLSLEDSIQVTHIGPLQELIQLKTLNLSHLRSLSDISVVSYMAQLEELDISGTHVSNLWPLNQCLQLKKLNAYHTPLRDLTALAHIPRLSFVNVAGTLVDNISALCKLVTLKELYCGGSAIRDFGPVEKLPSLSILQKSNFAYMDLKRTSRA